MILTQEQINQLKHIISLSLQKLYQDDIEIIQKGGMEQAASFRFGTYLYQHCQDIEWLKRLNFDMEYNKNGLEPKRTPRRPNGVRPDLIIHERNSNNHNILVIEIKGWWNLESRENDFIKIGDFVSQEGEYKYGLGVFLDLGKEHCIPDFFNNY